MNNPSTLALSTLIGTIVGAGIFALPYVIAQSGLIPALFYFLVLGVCVMFLHLFFGEVCLRTPGKHRLIGYADLYLGPWAKILVTCSVIIGTIGTLLAFMIVGGDFLRIILSPFISLSDPWHHLLFWAPLSLLMAAGIRLIARVELVTTIALFLMMSLIFLLVAPHISLSNFTLFSPGHVFLPYGVILFSLIGWNAIPEIAELFKEKKEKRSFKRIIGLASVVTIGLYLVFSLSVVGVSGKATSLEGLFGLLPFVGRTVVVLGAFFGLVSVADSFLIMGSYLKNSLRHDYRVPGLVAVLVASLAPLTLFLLGFREFIPVLSIVGILIGALEGVVIVALFFAARKKGTLEPEYKVRVPAFVPALIALILLGGAAVVVLSL